MTKLNANMFLKSSRKFYKTVETTTFQASGKTETKNTWVFKQYSKQKYAIVLWV